MSEPSAPRPSALAWRDAALVVGLAVLTFPPNFRLCGDHLDESWIFALNVAANRGLVHGRDLAFTYGPLGWLLAPLDYGWQATIAATARTGLHLLWWTAVWRLRRFCPPGFFPWLALAQAPQGFYAGPEIPAFERGGVLVGTVLLLLTRSLLAGAASEAWLAAALAGAALLMKFNLGVAAWLGLIGWCLAWASRRPGGRAAGDIAAALALAVGTCFALFVVASGGPADSFPLWLGWSWEIAAAYSSQMALPISAGAIPTAMLTIGILANAAAAGRAGVAAAAWWAPIAGPAFLCWKAAAVRSDLWHWWPADLACVALAPLPVLWTAGRPQRLWTGAAVASVALTWAVFALLAGPTLWTSGLESLRQTIVGSATLRQLRAAEAGTADERAFAPGRILEPPPPLPPLPAAWREQAAAGVDSVPFDLAALRGLETSYRPRFALQSYGAYTVALDNASAVHFAAADRPGAVLFRYAALADTHPLVADAATWQALHRHYDLADHDGGKRLWLRPRQEARTDAPRPLAKVDLAAAEWPIPVSPGGVALLRVRYRLTPAGQAMQFLAGATPPEWEFRGPDGARRRFRVTWRNAVSGFPASHLPHDAGELRDWFGPPPKANVAAIRLCPHPAFAVAEAEFLLLPWRPL